LLKTSKILGLLLVLTLNGGALAAEGKVAPPQAASLSYSDIADLADASPLILKVRIRSVRTVELPAPEGSKTRVRYQMVNATTLSLIRGTNGIAPQVAFMVAAPPKAKMAAESALAPVRLRAGGTMLLFARPAARAGQIQLVSRHAAQPWSEALETTTRAITARAAWRQCRARDRGGGATLFTFRVRSREKARRRYSSRRPPAPRYPSPSRIAPGETARWGVSLGEIVDETAFAPAPGSLLWYRLACSLPPTLPDISVRTLPLLDAESARRDYRFVIESLGSCGHTL
jgi:hypothetical protein